MHVGLIGLGKMGFHMRASARFPSRQADAPAMRMVALRNQFGGHAVVAPTDPA